MAAVSEVNLMFDRFMTDIVAVATAIIGLAIIAVLVGQKAQTSNVIGAAATGLANDIKAAVAPVS
jgi:PRD1 phage membrane DNA delivery